MSKKEDKALATLAKRVEAALDDGKAVDIRVLDVRKLTVITDYMIIASGRSSRQVRALAHRVMDTSRELGQPVIGIEGERESGCMSCRPKPALSISSRNSGNSARR